MLILQIACNNKDNLPKINDFLLWKKSIVTELNKNVNVTVRLVDKSEIHNLNLIYRGENSPTNVLAFPIKSKINSNIYSLGDIVICRQIVEHEAKIQKKNLKSHWAHIFIHGSLHLLGYKHCYNEEKKMEFLEIKIMSKLGYSNPYIIV